MKTSTGFSFHLAKKLGLHSIEFNKVYRHFKDQQVLKGLSFRVEPGRIYAVLGRNGAGKTTALRILLGFL